MQRIYTWTELAAREPFIGYRIALMDYELFVATSIGRDYKRKVYVFNRGTTTIQQFLPLLILIQRRVCITAFLTVRQSRNQVGHHALAHRITYRNQGNTQQRYKN